MEVWYSSVNVWSGHVSCLPPPSVVRMCHTEEASALFVMKGPEVLPILEFFW